MGPYAKVKSSAINWKCHSEGIKKIKLNAYKEPKKKADAGK